MNLVQILAGGHVRTVFQPVVDLDDGTLVGYEALTRGPVGELESPNALFAAARGEGRIAELDALCRTTALGAAVRAGITSPTAVFLNVEPDVLESESLAALIEIGSAAPGGLPVVLEITERAISSRPAELLACVRRLRAAGWRIALDDVGADDMSLAFMPLLRPDIVKLDISLVQQRPDPAVAGIMNAVNAYAQRSGAVLLAEGIENERHLDIARALGARLGQGWLFGRAETQLDHSRPLGELRLPPLTPAGPPAGVDRPNRTSPFEILPPGVALRRSTKPLLVQLSRHLEGEAMRHGAACVVVSTFQHAEHITEAVALRYAELAERVGFVAVVGEDMPVEPMAGVRGAAISGDDTLCREWDIVVLAPHFHAALLARSIDDDDDATGRDARFEFALTYDRDTVAAAAESLLSRVVPAAPTVSPTPAVSPKFASQTPSPPDEFDSTRQLRDTPNVSDVLLRAVAASTNGVTIADMTRPDHPLIFVNAAFERLSGYRADELLGTNCRRLQGAGTDAAAIQRIREAMAAGEERRETILNYRHASAEPWWNEIYLSPIFDGAGRLVQYIGVQNDVTERVQAEEQLRAEQARSLAYLAEIETLAASDPLTGLLNRRRLDDLLPSVLGQAQATGTGVAFLYVDIDGFKQVNDTHGHRTGDAVLAEVARRLRARLRHDDLIARLGGDEFLLVIPGLVSANADIEASLVAADCQRQLLADVAGTAVSASFGISIYPDDGADFDALLHAADVRMYAAKNRTRAVAG